MTGVNTKTLCLLSITFIALAGCATSTSSAPDSVTEVVEPVTVPEELSATDRAMLTVNELVAGGNTQTAIDRLTQLLGDASLSEEDRARVQFERGVLRQSENGFDLTGAVVDFGTVADVYPTSTVAVDAQARLADASIEVTALNDRLNLPETTRTQRFETLFRLGEHNQALDLMLSSGLKPDNAHLVAMYQIGYLCDGEDQTGPSYPAIEPDGTERELRFCDFGK